MNYLKHTLDNGTVLEIPEEFMVLDNLPSEDLHYKVELILDFIRGWVFKITHINGLELTQYKEDPTWICYFSPEKIFNKKIIPCSLEKFNNMKAFL